MIESQYRLSRDEDRALWQIEKKHPEWTKFQQEALTPITLSKHVNFKNNEIICEGIMGFGDEQSAASWLKDYTGTILQKGNEIVFLNKKFHWEGGGPLQYCNILYTTRDGKMFNVVPVGV
jgi:hypothetical protein